MEHEPSAHAITIESESMEEEIAITTAEFLFRDLAQHWLDNNAQRVLESLVSAKPRYQRQSAKQNLKESRC